MWPLVTLASTSTADRCAAARRRRPHRPNCSPLEDRHLLSLLLTKSAPASRFAGVPVVWTANARGTGANPVYRFSVRRPGGPFHLLRDFSTSRNLVWNPVQEGTYQIRVDVKPGFRATQRQTAITTYKAQSRVAGNSAVVSRTANPLVALYSAPPSSGSSIYVQFAEQSANPAWQDTTPLPIVPGRSTNFIVAGMKPHTTYLMRHVLDDGSLSNPLSFTTGNRPANLKFPTFTVAQPPAAGTDLTHTVLFHAGLPVANTINTVATNLNGDVVWYYDYVAHRFPNTANNLGPGGTVMLLGGRSIDNQGDYDTLREVDLAGNTLRETNIRAVNARLAAMHMPQILNFDHEAKRLPNGNIVVLARTPRTVNYRGKPTKFIGNEVLVLDPNLQPVWVWNAFRWLDTNRIGTDQAVASDWLHGNSVSWSPADQNLVISFRTQDWAVKINYANGKGDGRVLWKLGAGGDFTPVAKVPDPWFSHQHDVRYVNDNTVVVFDDSNIRHNANPAAHSRGQMWVLDEQAKTATLVVNADLGSFSPFLGGAQRLPGGNLAFTSGVLATAAGAPAAATIQVLPDGTPVYVQQMTGYEYRSYFERTLYSAGLLN